MCQAEHYKIYQPDALDHPVKPSYDGDLPPR